MSKSDRERRDAERAARRANRLAQRAQQRAERKEEQAQEAAERADRLAERANRRPRRQQDIDESIEDLVDQVTEKWTRKAEEWIDEQSSKFFEEDSKYQAEDESNFSGESDLDRDMDEEFDEEFDQERPRKRTSRSSGRSKRRRKNKWKYAYNWDANKWRFKTRYGRRSGNLYRDKRNKKICGVCAGSADYLGMETWQVRLIAVMGLIFIPSVAITVYFITYFLMDDKPYYRQVTDRFDDRKDDYVEEVRPMKRSRKARRNEQSETPVVDVSNREAMRQAKEKFGDIEDRLRSMETHVTSSTFELQRELRKISGDDA